MYGQKFGRKLVKPLRIDRIFLLSIRMTKNIQRFSETQAENWKRPVAPAMPCKRDKQHSSIVKTNVGSEQPQVVTVTTGVEWGGWWAQQRFCVRMTGVRCCATLGAECEFQV